MEMLAGPTGLAGPAGPAGGACRRPEVDLEDGFTDKGGHCLLFEAVRNGRTLIGVVLDSPANGVTAGVQDAERMLNWGFKLRQTG